MDAIRQTLAERITELERQNAERIQAIEDLWGRLRSAEAKSAETLKCFNIADATVAKMRTALDEIFMRVSYINIHGVGEQPEPTGLPQPMRASPDEFKRIWQEIGKLAGAALDETK